MTSAEEHACVMHDRHTQKVAKTFVSGNTTSKKWCTDEPPGGHSSVCGAFVSRPVLTAPLEPLANPLICVLKKAP